MAIAVVTTVLEAPIEKVWGYVGDFTTWHTWIPRITSTEMDPGSEGGQVGSVRRLTLSDGSTIREQLVVKDDDRRVIAYTFPAGSPFPVRRYLGRVRLYPVTTTGATFLHWSGAFDADEAVEATLVARFSATYTAFIAGLTEACAGAVVGG